MSFRLSGALNGANCHSEEQDGLLGGSLGNRFQSCRTSQLGTGVRVKAVGLAALIGAVAEAGECVIEV